MLFINKKLCGNDGINSVTFLSNILRHWVVKTSFQNLRLIY